MITKSKIRILTLDSGNLAQALVPAFVLSELEEKVGRPSNKMFDIFAGIGTSSFVAAGLSIPDYGGNLSSAADLSTYMLKNFKAMGKRRLRDRLKIRPGQPTYKANSLAKPVKAFFGGRKLSEAERELFLPVFDMSSGQMLNLSSWDARGIAADGLGRTADFSVADIVSLSMMAPLRFPPQVLHDSQGKAKLLAAGSSVYTNPTFAAYAAASALCSENTEIQIVSISVGQGQVETNFRNFRAGSPESKALQLNAAGLSAAATEMDKQFALLMGDDFYTRIHIDLPNLSTRQNHEISLRQLMIARKEVAKTIQDMDLSFLA